MAKQRRQFLSTFPVLVAPVLMLTCSLSWNFSAEAWGTDGHHVICNVAQALLTELARESVEELLPDNADGNLSKMCDWADGIKLQKGYEWSAPLHFIDTPNGECNYEYIRDCRDDAVKPGFCASGAINNYTSQMDTYSGQLVLQQIPHAPQLAHSRSGTDHKPKGFQLDSLQPRSLLGISIPHSSSMFDNVRGQEGHSQGVARSAPVAGISTSIDNLTEALMFLAHFVADIHQPLHVGFEGDHGGMSISLYWYNIKSNLHHVWDTDMIKEAETVFFDGDISGLTKALLKNITTDWKEEAAKWSRCGGGGITCPDEYAMESIKLACEWAYPHAKRGGSLSDAYFRSRVPILQKRMAQSAVRLAAILNRIYSDT